MFAFFIGGCYYGFKRIDPKEYWVKNSYIFNCYTNITGYGILGSIYGYIFAGNPILFFGIFGVFALCNYVMRRKWNKCHHIGKNEKK